MNKNVKSIINNIIDLISFISFITLGILTIICSNDRFEKTSDFLGIVIIVTMIPPILEYIINQSYKDKYKLIYVLFILINLIMGLIFIFINVNLELCCLIWGITSIIINIYMLVISILDIKINKLEIIEVILCIIEILFSILLCIELTEGVRVHLIIIGSSLLIKGIKYLIDVIIEYHEEKKGLI